MRSKDSFTPIERTRALRQVQQLDRFPSYVDVFVEQPHDDEQQEKTP